MFHTNSTQIRRTITVVALVGAALIPALASAALITLSQSREDNQAFSGERQKARQEGLLLNRHRPVTIVKGNAATLMIADDAGQLQAGAKEYGASTALIGGPSVTWTGGDDAVAVIATGASPATGTGTSLSPDVPAELIDFDAAVDGAGDVTAATQDGVAGFGSHAATSSGRAAPVFDPTLELGTSGPTGGAQMTMSPQGMSSSAAVAVPAPSVLSLLIAGLLAAAAARSRAQRHTPRRNANVD